MKNLLLILFLFLNIGQAVSQNEEQTYSGIESLLKKPLHFDLMRDYAFLISEKEEQQLQDKLHNYNKSTTTQIQIITIPNLENYQIDVLSLQVANLWKIGQAKKNNGVLILLVKEQQQIRIELGKGIKEHITEDELQIWLNQIKPLLKEKTFYLALDQLTTNFIDKLGVSFAPKGFEKLGGKEVWTFILFGALFFFMGAAIVDDGTLKFSFVFIFIWLIIALVLLFWIQSVWLGLIISGLSQSTIICGLIWWKNEKRQQKIQSDKKAKIIIMIEEAYQIYKKHDASSAQTWKITTENKSLKKFIGYNETQYAETELKKSKELEELYSYLDKDEHWIKVEKFYTLLPNLVSDYRKNMIEKFVIVPYKEKYKTVYFQSVESRLRLPFLSSQIVEKLDNQQIQNWLKNLISNNNLKDLYPAKLGTQAKQERNFLKTKLEELEKHPANVVTLFLDICKHWSQINKKTSSANSILKTYKTQNTASPSKKKRNNDDDDDNNYYRNNSSGSSSQGQYGGGSFGGDGSDSIFD